MTQAFKEPIFDRATAMERMGYSLSLFNELFELYQKDSGNFLGEISDGIATKNWELVTRSAHNLKSTSGNLGAMRVYGMALLIEKYGKSKGTQECPVLVEQVQAALAEFRADVLKFLDTQKA